MFQQPPSGRCVNSCPHLAVRVSKIQCIFSLDPSFSDIHGHFPSHPQGQSPPASVCGLRVFAGCSLWSHYLQVSCTSRQWVIQVLEDPGSSHLFLYQLWTSTAARLSPGHTEPSWPNLAGGRTGWPGSDDLGSQENISAMGSPCLCLA